MKNCSFASITGQIKCFVAIDGKKEVSNPFFTNNEKENCKNRIGNRTL